MSNLYWLTDEQMARLRRSSPRATASLWLMTAGASGIVFVNRNGLR
jgi:hypothetical protein